MKIRDYGLYSLITSLIAWAIAIVFTVLSWWAIGIEFKGHQGGEPRPDTPIMYTFSILAALSYPVAVIAVVFAIIALYKKQSWGKATFGGISALILFVFLTFGFWIAIHGGV